MTEQRPPPDAKRRLLMAGAALGGVLLGLVLLVTVFGGGGEPEVVALPARAAPEPATEATVAQAAPAEAELPAALTGVRDPFLQVVTVPDQALGDQAPLPAQTAPPDQDAPGSTQPPAAPGGGSGSAVLELKSVSADDAGVIRADLTVDGQSFSPAEGETFSHGYRLERIEGNCVEVSAEAARAQMCLAA